MNKPMHYLDKMSDDSLASKQSKSEWLEFLESLRDELDIRIQMVRQEVKNDE